MNRQIKFRGLRTDGKGWVYGSLFITNDGECYIIDGQGLFKWYDVHPESVGQFTGLLDKNGHDIYEGDLFDPDQANEETRNVVAYIDVQAKFVVQVYGFSFHIGEDSQEVYDSEESLVETYDFDELEGYEIIGNIHEKEVKQ